MTYGSEIVSYLDPPVSVDDRCMGVQHGRAGPHPAYQQQHPDVVLAGHLLAQVVNSATDKVALHIRKTT